MVMASVTVRVDEDTKRQASAIAEDLGLDLSSVTRAFYRQIVRERRIPLDLSCSPLPAETADALAEARSIAASGAARFDTADDMFAALGI
ncbi:type II toxin-antitoxin system RelB/DinJ family antitoxin [Bifidobacterium pullorum subsp. saeculare]|uniref:Type II toxin-antitoxin system RelB/DinJ family antitoxin n=1 Tax=Bifidobacterium pullorum subsp. saeculare TaxID=78257 RepID=A0A938WW55_9BIFI|nr:type II toxin-antitoxin system RelB/DinJ family antitoxin [Bifidobacterium pullorum]MBM6700000.1 type II toxin-antitoxin system RelB/DinJ family antitoxin [Bifidobacterium pullorum subsp. saeculare]